jgi:GMP synthase (glutamine-hydrolysing)
MTDRPRLLALLNDSSAPPARFGDWLAAAGVDVEVLDLVGGASVPTELPAGFAGLLPLGGGIGATDDHLADWLPTERALLANAVSAGQPVLGICLGGQLLAAATGGVVALGAIPELGVLPIELTPAAATDRLFSVLPPGVRVPQFHRDGIFAAPPGAVALAHSPGYPWQGFRIGERAWGVQFHPEVDAAILAEWLVGEADIAKTLELEPAVVVADLAAAEDEIERVWRPFAAAFADVVSEYARG